MLAHSELQSVDGIDRIAPDMVGARPPMPEIELSLRRDGDSPSTDARGSTSVEDGSMVQGAEAAQPSQLVREAQEPCSQSQLGKLALTQKRVPEEVLDHYDSRCWKDRVASLYAFQMAIAINPH